VIKLTGQTESLYGSGRGGRFSYSDLSLLRDGNQAVYRIASSDGLQSGYVVKELKPEFHGESPHKAWNGERRAEAAVDAYEKFPDLFPETIRIGPRSIRQKYVGAGTTYGAALKRGNYGTIKTIFGNLKRLHDAGYVHGDITGGNIQSESALSVDTETFGPGDPAHDLSKARRVAGEKGRGLLADRAIAELYSQPVLEGLGRAA